MSHAYLTIAATGLTASSFLLLANLGAARFGVMPLILSDANRKSAGLDVLSSVRAWEFFFDKAKDPVVACTVLQTVSYAALSTFHSQSQQQTLLWVAAASGIAPLPFTLAFSESSAQPIPQGNDGAVCSPPSAPALSPSPVMPSIKALKTISSRTSTAPLSQTDEKLALSKLKEWNDRHKIRMCIFATSLITGILGIFLPILPL
jgi:hypothetical protein